jgi:O-antigen/teichoic acid export membrane protein
MQFWPVILSAAVPALVSLLAVFPLAVFYGDYRVMLWAIVIRAAMIALTSQIVAKRRFQLVLDRAIMAQSVRFGWPLLVNGALMFAVFQGDKLIVGRELGMATLAIFAMGFTLTLTPTLVMAKSAQNFFLPQLSAIDRDTPAGAARFQTLAMVAMQVSLLNAALLVVIFVLVGAPVVSFLLGEKYAPLLPLLAPLAVMQGLRVAKAGGAMVALSCGHTRNAMQANLMRIATLPLVWMAVVQGAGLLTVIAIASCGEIAGYLLSLYLVRRKPGVSLRQMIWPVVLVALLMAAAIGLPLLPALPAWVAWGIPTVLMLFVLLSMKALRDYVLRRGRKTKTSQ